MYSCLCVFFFQAEDGIRDLVRSRGLGDVYKRQAKILAMVKHEAFPHVRDYFVETDRQYLVMELVDGEDLASLLERRQGAFPVSYTHLTLPTSDLV